MFAKGSPEQEWESHHVPLNKFANAALKQLLSKCEGKGWVFMSVNGDRLQGPRHWFEPAVKDAGIPNFHWHDLRHTFASRLRMAGVDLGTIQELMGHKSIQMTVRYAEPCPHLSIGGSREADGRKEGGCLRRAGGQFRGSN